MALKINSVEEFDIVSMYMSGKSILDISRLIGRSQSTIHGCLKRNGVDRRSKEETDKSMIKPHICIACGKIFRITGGSKYRKTCSHECSTTLRSGNIKCNICGSNHMVSFYFKDGDSYNVSKENVVVLCDECKFELAQ